MSKVLVIDDNQAVATALKVLLSLENLDVLTASSPKEGLRLLATEPVDLVIQDMNFSHETTSGKEGVDLFRAIRSQFPELPIILLTAWTHLETAVELVREGAADYLGKPWDDDKLLTAVRNLTSLSRAREEARRLAVAREERHQKLAEAYDLCGIVYEADAMHDVVSLACRIAHADVSVLITGPNGAGKEKIAEIIQANSTVCDGPFLKINVGALPEDLMESELFGVEAGAYTGASKSRAGRFEAADGGTLFLDEVGNLSLDGQAKLLRVLQTGDFERLGSNQTRRVNVRVISATNTDLNAAISEGRFRQDLYYRLNVIEIAVPPLAERPDDIVPLAGFFLQSEHRLAPDARQALLAHDWPGNVRELRNRMQRALLLTADKDIRASELDLSTTNPAHTREPGRAEIETAMDQADGVVAKAARELGMSRQALYRRLQKHGIVKS